MRHAVRLRACAGDTVKRATRNSSNVAARAGVYFAPDGPRGRSNPAWLKSHRQGGRGLGRCRLDEYSNAVSYLNRNGGLCPFAAFITPPEATATRSRDAAADGLVCLAHYTADLVDQKGRRVFVELIRRRLRHRTVYPKTGTAKPQVRRRLDSNQPPMFVQLLRGGNHLRLATL